MMDIRPVGAEQAAQSDPAELVQRHEAWLAAVEQAQADAGPVAPDPTALGRRGTRDGALFMLGSARGVVYTSVLDMRIGSGGRLEDRSGLPILGFVEESRPGARRVQSIFVTHGGQEWAGTARYEVDEYGVLWAIPPQTAQSSGRPSRRRIARLAVAIFPAPQNLQAAESPALLHATPAAGRPVVCPADAPGLARLNVQPESPVLAHLRDELQEMWMAANRAETRVALVQSRDALDRIALDVVK